MMRIKSWILSGVTALGFFFSAHAYAVLDIQLTDGISRAVPIAVVPFEHESLINDSTRQLSKIISHDLAISGQFRILSMAGVSQTPFTAAAVDYQFWRQQKVDDVIVGQIKQVGFDQYQVTIGLVDLYRGALSPTKTLLDEKFTVSKNELRGLAHHISDLIYEKLTGERGIFSTRLAYVLVTKGLDGKKQYSLQVSDMDGYNAKSIMISPQPIMSPAWSPDGRKIAYVTFETKLPEIYVSNVMTGERRKVTSFPGINGAPAWSPDGSKLAVALSFTQGNPNIYVIDLASTKLSQITRDGAINTEPAWAPDGRSLVFTSDRGGNPQVYRVNLATLQTSRITFDGNYNASASFLPDAKNIVLLHRGDTRFNIAVMDLGSGVVTEITKAGRDDSPAVAPNGKMVAYATQYGGNGVLAMVSTDGNVKLRLPDVQGIVQEPAWSPYMS